MHENHWHVAGHAGRGAQGVLLGLLLAACGPGAEPAHPAALPARYVLVFHGDGMGPEHIRAGGMFVNGLAGTLAFESFAHQARMTHDNASGTTTDSAASATAMATGIKVDNGVVAMRVPGDGADVPSVLDLHKAQRRSVGLVTESFMTDASPAAYGAHARSRDDFSTIFRGYLQQSRPNVLLGGGDNGFDVPLAAASGYTVVTDRASLLALDPAAQTHVAGSFGAGLIPPDGTAGRNPSLPTLPEMAQEALAILDTNPKGFFLFVEHEGMDEFSHANDADSMVKSMGEFNQAVQAAIRWVEDPATPADWENTLMVVLADHETGGLTVTETQPQPGRVPAVTWGTSAHTRTPVRVFARGPGAERLNRELMDNTDIFPLLAPPSAAP